ncbi:hypothetical protein [uncultured Desulfovibrio sp.]|uniref:hypothetical protein n=1 Tax=uncultured Desulfovibrio sp. TaxID=167968 RepID=UPI00261799A6|nr:hypothetical protein [uncultured Desulfovibrio sp.]
MDTPYRYRPVLQQAERDALFFRMREEGLTPCAMYACQRPSLSRWRHITRPRHGLLLVCEQAAATPSAAVSAPAAAPAAPVLRPSDSAAPPLPDTDGILAVGLFSGWRGQVAEFDFTVFRRHFSQAVPIARGAFQWMFAQTDVSAIMGLCPVSNAHAWRLATACGFRELARLPRACWLARRRRHVDGVLVCCTPDSLAAAGQDDPPAA